MLFIFYALEKIKKIIFKTYFLKMEILCFFISFAKLNKLKLHRNKRFLRERAVKEYI
jgi:hypothetical protein